LGGILRSVVWWTAVSSRLFSGSPGTMAGPESPPLRMDSREVRERPPLAASWWQPPQELAKMGRTLFSKKSSPGEPLAWATVSRATTGWEASIPGGAATDPLDEIGDVAVGELLALGGHLEVAGLLDGLDEEALVGIARGDGRAVVAPLEQGCVGVEAETAGLLGGVAAVAALREDRANLLGEELDVVLGAGFGTGGRAGGGCSAGRDGGRGSEGGGLVLSLVLGFILSADGRQPGRRQGGDGGEGTEGEITGRSRKWPQSVSPS
jgi:hypothetical protein